MAYIRQFKTGAGAVGVQVCEKQHGKVVSTRHIGSARGEEQLKKLLKKAREVIDREKTPLFDLSKYDELPKNRKIIEK